MPNWTDDEGTSWFGKIECKRCLQMLDQEKGEVPVHLCLGGKYYTSDYVDGVHYYPIPATDEQILALQTKRKKRMR
jgi:hypothetical protein